MTLTNCFRRRFYDDAFVTKCFDELDGLRKRMIYDLTSQRRDMDIHYIATGRWYNSTCQTHRFGYMGPRTVDMNVSNLMKVLEIDIMFCQYSNRKIVAGIAAEKRARNSDSTIRV